MVIGNGTPGRRLRVAIVAGTLARGGAEKQLVYLVEALRAAGAEVRVFCLTRGEFFESALREQGVEPVWVGQFGNPLLRVLALASALRDFRPHILQSAHFYTNLYVGLVAPMYGAIGIGTARSDVVHEVDANGLWGRWLLRVPSVLMVNSHAARRNAMAFGIAPDAVEVLPNAIDLRAFDELAAAEAAEESEGTAPVVVGVGSLVAAKRFDRFLHAIAMVRARGVDLRGVLVGDGPEREKLESLARRLDLLPDGVRFTGSRDDVPALLRRAQIYLLTSDHEGFPNVLLEAMAATLPVVTTPAGDAAAIVRHGETGYVVSGDDLSEIAFRLEELAASPPLRQRLGGAGRRRVEILYTSAGLAERVAALHHGIAERLGHRRSLAALSP